MRAKLSERWIVVYLISTVQIAVAVFAVYSSNRDILSDGACIGGIFGTLANFVILLIAAIVASLLALRSWNVGSRHLWLMPMVFLFLSSGIAIPIGSFAAMRCTV